MEIHLIELSRVRRTFTVSFGERDHVVAYHGDGMGYESVVVNGMEIMRESSGFEMTPRFEFALEGHLLRFEIRSGFWMNLLGPIWPGHLERFAFAVDDEVVYEDRKGMKMVRG